MGPGSEDGRSPAERAARIADRWGAAGVTLVALIVRLVAYLAHGRDLAHTKYAEAAQLAAAGLLDGARALDFSPLYLDLHRLALWAGLADGEALPVGQCLVGALACGIVCGIGRRLAGSWPGIAAGLTAALSLDLTVYAPILDVDTLLVALVLVALWALVAAPPRHRAGSGAVAGAALGLAIACRPATWLALPVVALALLRAAPAGRRRAPLLALLAGLAAVQSGFAIRSATFSAGAGAAMSPWQVLHAGNNPLALGLRAPDPLVKDLEQLTDGRGPDVAHELFREVAAASTAGTSGERQRYWLDLSLRFAGDYPARFASLLLHKALAIGQPFESHDHHSADELQRRLEGWPLLSTSLLVPLGVCGLILAWRRLWLAAALAAVPIAVCIVFFVSVRYRLLLVPCAALGIGAIAHAGEWARAGGRRRVLAALAACAALFALFRLPLAPARVAAPAMRLQRLANARFLAAQRPLREHDLVGVAAQVAEAFYVAPWLRQMLTHPGVPLPVEALARQLAPRARDEARRAADDPWAARRLALLLELSGATEEALRAYRAVEAAARLPGDAPLLHDCAIRRGVVALRAGRTGAARDAFAGAARLRPGSPAALVGQAIAEPRRGPELLRRACRVNPCLEVAYLHGRMLLEVEQPAAAREPLARLVRALPRYPRARMLYAVALAGSGQLTRAVDEALRAQRGSRRMYDADFRPLALMQRAAEAQPAAVGGWLRLADAAEYYGELALALRAWQRVEGLRPLGAAENARLGWLLLRHRRAPAALQRLERARAAAPGLPGLREALQLARRRLATAGR